MTLYLQCLLIFLLLTTSYGNLRAKRREFYAHEQISGIEGSDVELECDLVSATFETTPQKFSLISKVEWVKNGAVVASFSKGELSAEWWVSGIRLQLDRQRYKLLIWSIQPSDQGTYTCIPQFETLDQTLWKARPLEAPQRIELIVIGVPSRPGRAVVTSYTSRSATLIWESSRVQLDAPIQQYTILIHKGTEANSTNHSTVISEGNSTTSVVSSLHPYTHYVFQVVAQNRAGKSIPGPVSYPIRTKGEAPSVSPYIRSVYNTSNTSLMVNWSAPNQNTLHGPLVGYRIMTHRLSSGVRKELYIRDPAVTSYELTNLSVYQKYMISLETDNNFGYSPAATVVVMTDEGVPTSPPIITNLSVLSSQSFEVTWSPPKYINGRVRYYKIHCQSISTGATTSMRVDEAYSHNHIIPISTCKIVDLLPYTKYRVWVTAATSKGEGPSSESNVVCTDTDSPSAPQISNITLKSKNLVSLHWIKPVTYYRSIDLYMLKLSILLQDNTESLSQIYNTTEPHLSLYNSEVDRLYIVRIQAVTRSIIHPHVLYIGPESVKQAFLTKIDSKINNQITVKLLTSACSVYGSILFIDASYGSVVCDTKLINGYLDDHTYGSRVTLITLSIMLAIASLAFIIVFLYLFWRRKERKGSGYQSPTYIQCTTLSYDPYDSINCPSIDLASFPSHVAKMRADSGVQLSAEFEAIDAEALTAEQKHILTSENSLLPCNKPKNRYVNIIAYDQSRVVLKTIKGIPGSDYVNANFVDGYHKRRAYIATQGPLESTFGDFWRMVWEQKTQVIVMITNVVEKGRKKCDMYWPSEASETYGGHFQVRLINEYSTAFYAYRVLALKNLSSRPRCQERMIYHYQYTNWPDHGVPPDSLPVLSFIRKSSSTCDKPSSGPMVVHCSAGVGRSGTYMLLDSMIRQIKDRQCINIKGYLKHIRQQRNFLVQTEEQYMFCHDSLLEYLRCGDTEVCVNDYSSFFNEGLHFLDQTSGKTILESQFEQATAEDPRISHKEATKAVNKSKNRLESLVTSDEHRVVLSNITGVDGSDYINSTFMPGFNKVNEFVVTQTPLTDTAADFWRLIWEQNCQTIVLLSDALVANSFWPSVDSIGWRYTNFYMYTTEEASGKDWSCVDLLLQSSSDEFQLPCRLLYCPNWTHKVNSEVWDLIRAVQDWSMQYQNGPITVVDGPGGSDAAKFCTLAALSNQLEQEGVVDVFQFVRLYHVRRPGVCNSQLDLVYLYSCIEHLLESTDSDTESNCQVAIHRPGSVQPISTAQSRDLTHPPISNPQACFSNNRPNSIHSDCATYSNGAPKTNIMNRSLVYPAITHSINGSNTFENTL